MSTPLPPTTLIFAPKGRRPLALPILRGQVVVISDASGILPNDWQLSLLENSPSGTARVIQDGEVLSQDLLHLVGFNLPLPDLPVREYLATFCANTESIEREFELSEVASLSCAYLPPAPSRQIALLHAFSQERGIIVLNDPFLPFNGRWRESFAAFIAEQASLGGAAVVCCNVGFMPKTWSNLPSVKTQDVAGLLPLPPEARVATPQTTSNHSSSPSPTPPPRQVNEANAAYYVPGIPVPIPASAIKVYKGAKDWLFEPLATASRFLRTWTGIVVTIGLSVVLGTMGVLLVPNLPEARALLQRISEKFNYQWQDITSSLTQSKSPDSESSHSEPSKLVPASDSTTTSQEGSALPSSSVNGDTQIALLNPGDLAISQEGVLNLDQGSQSPFPRVSGIPLNWEMPSFSPLLPEANDERDGITVLRELLSDKPEFALPFGTHLSATLSYSCAPFKSCIGWSGTLQNLQSPETIKLSPKESNEMETEITLQGDTNPLGPAQ